MLTWLKKLKEANKETRLFIFTTLLYTAAVILPTIYCYARLDFVRSYDTTKVESVSEGQNTNP